MVTVIAQLLPASVAAAESFGDPPQARLLEGEREALGEAGEARVREFTTVRHCARQALAGLGLPPAPLLRGPRGAPLWPRGVTGSMTHCAGYRAAAVARSAAVRSLGIDAEPRLPLPEGVLEAVTLPGERAWLAAARRREPQVPWDRLLFCAKEAVYKAWYPLTHRWIGFHEATVTPGPVPGTFHARLHPTGSGSRDSAGCPAGLAPRLAPAAASRAAPHATAPGTSGEAARHVAARHVFEGRWLAREGLLMAAVVCVPA